MSLFYPQIPEFDSQPEEYKKQIIQRVKDYMKSKEYSAETFEKFSKHMPEPSTILVELQKRTFLKDQ